jgi:mevalonate kinase
MSGRKVVAKSSAPGKAILFGEQAVVHGATAIAAAVSDLRIEVDMILEEIDGKDEVIVIFEDLKLESGDVARITLPFSYLSGLMPINEDHSVDTAFVPDAALQAKLQSEFSTYPGNVASGLITIAFFAGYILLPCIDSDFSSQHRQLQVNIKSEGLPIGAGLGSSAAFSVAASASCFQLVTNLKEMPNETVLLDQEMIERINSWAYSGEVLMHGNPSGLDNTTSSFGGLVSFIKDPTLGIQFSAVPNPPKLRILLVNTRVPRSTRQLVANVSALYHAYPAVIKPMFDSITQVTNTFKESIEALHRIQPDTAEYDDAFSKFIEETGLLMDINHHILNALGVGHSALTQVISIAAAADCHAKLTGAGGGGCAIVLLPSDATASEKEEDLTHHLRAAGFDVFVSDIAGRGVQWH